MSIANLDVIYIDQFKLGVIYYLTCLTWPYQLFQI